MYRLLSTLRRVLRHPNTGAALSALAVLVGLLLLWQRVNWWYSLQLRLERENTTLAHVANLANGMSLQMGLRLGRVQRLGAFVQAEADNPNFASAFGTFAADLDSSLPHVRAIVVAPQGTIRHVYPAEGNEALLGYALPASNVEELHADTEYAAQTGELVLSGPVRLSRDEPDLIAWQAVTRDGAYWGLVAIVFDVPALLNEIGPSFDDEEVYIHAALRDNMGRVFAGNPALFSENPSVANVVLGSEHWELAMLPSGSWAAAIRQAQRVFQGAGLAIVFLVTLLTYQSVNRQAQLRRAVAQRTQDLARANTELVEAQQSLEQRVADRTRAIGEMGHRITSLTDLDHLLTEVVQLIQNSFGYYHVGIGVVEGDEVLYRAGAGQLWDDPAFDFHPKRLKIGRHGMTGWVAASGEPLLARDVSQEPQYLHMAGSQARSELILPIKIQGAVIGVLDVQSERLDAFDDTDLVVLQSLADQVGVAMQNARLFAAERRRSEQLDAINEVGHQITSILDVNELLSRTVHLIHDNFGYHHVHIGLIEGDVVVFPAVAGVWAPEPHCACCVRHLRIGQDGTCGWVAATGEPLLVPDINQDPRYIPVKDSQSGSEVVLPLKIKGQVIGVLDVESDQINAFDASDVNVLQSLANHVAVAIENARLYNQAQALAALQERQRLARELHDSVSQALYGISLGTRTALTLLEQAEGDAVEAQRLAIPLEYTMSLVEAGLAEMRALIFELRPESLEKEGLVAALQKQAAAVQARHRITVETHLSDEPDIPPAAKETLYRVAQEALHNVVKHARASLVELSLAQTPETVELCIHDNGRGFDTSRDYPGHLGLHSMRERLEGEEGTFQIESEPGHGTHVRATIHLV